jgi:hypothetical protein
MYIHNANTALLIDFENLILGLEGDDDLDPDERESWSDEPFPLDPGLFYRLVEDEGQVAVARAYADWRHKRFNHHQVELYRQGIELVHVLGKGYRGLDPRSPAFGLDPNAAARASKPYKNAVDLRLAVDALELSYELPHINTFVLVSGDRDFIHLIKHLRKRNKRVIGVAPQRSASRDLAALCDRFMTYRALWLTYHRPEVPEANAVDPQRLRIFKVSLVQLLQEQVGDDGISGAGLKTLIRRHISPAFDESDFGYSKFSAMMRDMPDIVRVEQTGSSDVLIRLVPGLQEQAPPRALASVPAFVARPVPARFIPVEPLDALSSEDPPDPDLIAASALLQERLGDFKERLKALLQEQVGDDGISGVRLKGLIQRHISPEFHEADFGYTKFSALMRDMPDLVRVEAAAPGHVRIIPVRPDFRNTSPTDAVVDKARVRLLSMALDWERTIREKLLRDIHQKMTQTNPFTFNGLVAEFEEEQESVGGLKFHGYLQNCYHSKMFYIHPEDRNLPIPDRRMSLQEPYMDFHAFMRRFEQSLVHKVFKQLPDDPEKRAACVMVLLELPEDATQNARDMIADIERDMARM